MSSAPLPDAQRSGHWVDTHAPAAWRPYLKLARIDRPIGWWLLLLPCWWSASLAALAAGQPGPPLSHLLLFLVGAVVMRGAGTTFNDIVDRDLDAQVARTRGRPLPSGAVSAKAAAAFMLALCLMGLVVLLQFNRFAIALGVASLAIVAVYPFMKRIMSLPQLVLGLAFAWGGLMGWAAQFGALAAPAWLVYAAAIAWTIAYDTIYALQDIEDDEIVGIRSSARLFGGSTRPVLILLYAAAVACLGLAALLAGGGWLSFAGVAGFAAHLAWQIGRLSGAGLLSEGRAATPQVALALFRSNRDAGLIPFAGFALDALLRGWIG